MTAPATLPRGYHVGAWLLSMAAIIGVWQLGIWLGISRLLLPPPLDVAKALITFKGPIADATLVTLTEVLLGFTLAVVVGMALAIAITYSGVLRSLIYPPVLLLHSVPKLAIAPILLLWFGLGLASKVVVAFLIAFFPILIETTTGLRNVDPELHELARSLNAPGFRTFRKIDLPHALPSIFAGLRVGITLAVTGAIVGEYLAADEGLGFLLATAGSQYLTDLAFAVVIVLAALSMLLFGAVVLAERLIVPWGRIHRR